MDFTVSHKVSGGKLWLYFELFGLGSTVRCVTGVFAAAYLMSAPTNKPVNGNNVLAYLFLNPSSLSKAKFVSFKLKSKQYIFQKKKNNSKKKSFSNEVHYGT